MRNEKRDKTKGKDSNDDDDDGEAKKIIVRNLSSTSNERSTREYNEVESDAYCIAPVQWLLFTIDQQYAKARRREMVGERKGDPR